MKKGTLVLFLLGTSFWATSQSEDYIWRLGNNGGIDFNSGVDTFSIPNPNYFTFNLSNASICDPNGNLLFFTNGIVVFNSNSDTMLNGDNLNPSAMTTLFSQTGMRLPQGEIILRKPGYPNIYYLFHETYDSDTASINPLQTNVLYYSTIDMSLDNGKGAVIQGKKNIHLYDNDTLLPGKLTAVRHGNGRDWWLISKRACYPEMLEWLITPDSILGPFSISLVNDPNTCYDDVGAGQACVSPQGDRIAFYFGSRNIFAYNIDRCTGNLTEIFHSYVADSILSTPFGCAFSSNGQYLYLSTEQCVFQFDMNASNIELSKSKVAQYDGFNSPAPPFKTLFSVMRLAPDNRIYISTPNGCDVMHVIEFPDSGGLACSVMQHSFYMPTLNVITVPNIPDYKLGTLVGSGCDTVLSLSENQKTTFSIVVYPNPNNGTFGLKFNCKRPTQYLIEVKDISGRFFIKTIGNAVKGTNLREINLSELAKGIYFLNLISAEINETIKVIIE